MATIADMTAAIAAMKTQQAATEQALSALIAEVAALRAQLANPPAPATTTLDATDQASVDQAVADAESITAAMATDQQNAEAATNPPATTGPAPADAPTAATETTDATETTETPAEESAEPAADGDEPPTA